MERVSFTDSNGVTWSVAEEGADGAPLALHPGHAAGAAWLRFESDLEVRRLWRYPDDWRGLTAPQLESLLARASTVIARFRPAAARASLSHRPSPPGAPAQPGTPRGAPAHAAGASTPTPGRRGGDKPQE